MNKVRDVAQTKGVRPLPLHCTRHSFISWALTAATPTKRVSEWCGVSVSVLERTYAHVIPDVEPDVSFAEIGRGTSGAKWG